jgi:16S rRNA G966 N2-methylase RsmD
MKITLNRTFWFRSIAIFIILVFAVFLFFIGKQHTILLDNKTVTVGGKEINALQLVEVQINNLEPMELAARDRDKEEVTGQKHSVTIIYTDPNWEEHTIERTFKVPLMQEMVLLSIPTLVANPEADQSLWLENYEPPTYAVTAVDLEEEVVTDDLTLLLTDI